MSYKSDYVATTHNIHTFGLPVKAKLRVVSTDSNILMFDLAVGGSYPNAEITIFLSSDDAEQLAELAESLAQVVALLRVRIDSLTFKVWRELCEEEATQA